MNKQELLKQADYNFQRGNRKIAEKFLSELLAQYPNEESAWMLLARVVEDKDRKIECYERTLKINPNNYEAKIGLVRTKSPDKTLPLRGLAVETPYPFPKAPSPFKKILRSVVSITVLALIFGTTTYVIAQNNPESNVAKLIIPPTATPFAETLADGVAAQTRAEVSAEYPQYAPLVDALISLAISNAKNGMEGAPERPGAEIFPSDAAAKEGKTAFENALPQPGSLNTATLTEQQITSWLAVELRDNPDLPLKNVQVFLRNGQIQVWGMVEGTDNSTSALIIGKTNLDNGTPSFEIDSMQIGQQVIPDILLSQAESWLNELITEKIDEQVPGLRVMNINVSSGLITMSGMR
jgi:tetratricopeptide (TPR) repeat protein